MIEVTVLGSGSSGNATLVRSPRTSILIDAGFSLRQLKIRMQACGWSPSKLDAIILSHEHHDHINGLRVLCSRNRLPVFATEATHDAPELRKAGLSRVEKIIAGEEFAIGEFTVTPFAIPHDAADPLGFVVGCNGVRLGHVTDLGYASALTRHHLRGCHLLVLETNHDPDMLIEGPYPWPVKQRILSRTGHLSNSDAAELLGDVATAELQAVFPAHLSRENNSPDLALGACEEALRSKSPSRLPKLIITDQSNPTPLVRAG